VQEVVVSAAGPTTETGGTGSADAARALVAGHQITSLLKALAVTDEQLASVCFRASNQGWPFDDWSVCADGSMPDGAAPYLKLYCTLKWLIIEEPPHSRDKEAAWRSIAEFVAASTFEIGLRAKESQRARAKKPRGKVDDGRAIRDIITGLASKPEYREDKASELWPHLHNTLDELELSPDESGDPADPAKSFYTYDFKGKRKRLTYGRFKNIVSEHRKASR